MAMSGNELHKTALFGSSLNDLAQVAIYSSPVIILPAPSEGSVFDFDNGVLHTKTYVVNRKEVLVEDLTASHANIEDILPGKEWLLESIGEYFKKERSSDLVFFKEAIVVCEKLINPSDFMTRFRCAAFLQYAHKELI